jgi:hypothetical protein
MNDALTDSSVKKGDEDDAEQYCVMINFKTIDPAN